MEKLSLFIMPIIAVSFLGSCGNSPQPQVIEHFVSFESYGGGHFPTQRVKDGETATKPDKTPERGSDTFLGWFTDFDEPAYTFTEKVTEDITLYAGWEVVPDPKTTCKFKFTGTNCSINGYKDEPFEITLPKGIQTQFQINPEDGYSFPTNDKTHFNVKKGSIDEYDAAKGLIKIGDMNSDIEIEAKAISTVPSAESFENDLWETFLDEINGKTYYELTQITCPYHNEWENNKQSFVGLHRTLTIENQKGEVNSYQVLTVDENKSAGINDAKFTFMIVNLNHEMAFSLNDNFYPNSNIHSYLNGVLLCGFPTVVKQHIPTVSIECYNPDPFEPKTVSIDTSLYIPSASQIFGNDVIPVEGNQLVYFSRDTSKDILNGAWLRTPDTVTKKIGKYVNNGEVNDDFITESHLITPIFNIK